MVDAATIPPRQSRLGGLPALSPQAERRAFARYRDGLVAGPDGPASLTPDARAAADLIARSNLGLVASIAGGFRRRHLDADRLFSAGSLGLARAIFRFDAGRGFKFSTYATPWIRNAIRRDIMMDRTVHVPFEIQEAVERAKRAAGKTWHGDRPGEEPGNGRGGDPAGEPPGDLPPGDITRARAAMRFDGIRGDDAEILGWVAARESRDESEAEARRADAIERLSPIFARLTEDERAALLFRESGLDYPTIGLELGMTDRAARHAYERAIRYARRAAAGDPYTRRARGKAG